MSAPACRRLRAGTPPTPTVGGGIVRCAASPRPIGRRSPTTGSSSIVPRGRRRRPRGRQWRGQEHADARALRRQPARCRNAGAGRAVRRIGIALRSRRAPRLTASYRASGALALRQPLGRGELLSGSAGCGAAACPDGAALSGAGQCALDACFPGNGIDVDHVVDDLSIGQRQMVEIARAAAAPRIRLLVLDEPTSSLDLGAQPATAGLHPGQAEAGLRLHLHQPQAARNHGCRGARSWSCATGASAWRGAAAEHRSGPGQAMGGDAEVAFGAQHGARRFRKAVRLRVSWPVAEPLGREIEFCAGEIVGLAGLEGSGAEGVSACAFSRPPVGRAGIGARCAEFRLGRPAERRRFPVLECLRQHGHRARRRAASRWRLSPTADGRAAMRDAAENGCASIPVALAPAFSTSAAATSRRRWSAGR